MKLPTSRADLLALKGEVDKALKASGPKVGDTMWVEFRVVKHDPDDYAEFLLEAQADEDPSMWVSRDQIDSILASQPKTGAAKAPRRAGRKGA